MYILFLVLAFILLLTPAYLNIWNAVRSVFAAILCKEIIDKDNPSKKELTLLVRHMQRQPYALLRKIIVKRNMNAILKKFSKATSKQLDNVLYGTVKFSYRSNYKKFGESRAAEFAVALRNMATLDSDSFEKIQNMVIDKAREFNHPEILYHFAIAIEDLGYSFRTLYTAIVRYRNSSARQSFELRYKNKPEIERLITISP